MKDNVILLVEDCTEDASLVARAFKKWGVTNPMEIAVTGEEAVQYFTGEGKFADRQAYPLPCIALLDLNLPQMSGFEVLQWLRSKTDFANLPVVVLSGTKDPTHFDEAHKLGANACVVKTLDLAELYELIQHLNYFSRASDFNNGSMDWFPETENEA